MIDLRIKLCISKVLINVILNHTLSTHQPSSQYILSTHPNHTSTLPTHTYQQSGVDMAKLRTQSTHPINIPYHSPYQPILSLTLLHTYQQSGVDMAKLRTQEAEEESKNRRQKKQLSSPELWEARQLIAAGVLSVEEYPMFDAESGMGMLQSFELEEDVEVELNDIEPAFLRGQTRMSKELSPVRIVKVRYLPSHMTPTFTPPPPFYPSLVPIVCTKYPLILPPLSHDNPSHVPPLPHTCSLSLVSSPFLLPP